MVGEEGARYTARFVDGQSVHWTLKCTHVRIQDKYWAWAGNLARKLQARALEPPVRCCLALPVESSTSRPRHWTQSFPPSSTLQEEHPTAEVETVAGGVNRLEGCLFVGHTNTDTDRLVMGGSMCACVRVFRT